MALKTTRGAGGRSGNTETGAVKGRGATNNMEGRFERLRRERFDDGWAPGETEAPATAPVTSQPEDAAEHGLGEDDALPALKTEVTRETAKTIIARNDSPDIPFEQSINPYRGCEHGCVYCLDGDTRILMGDGSTKPLRALEVGDEIYGTEKRGHYRRYVRTRVLAHWRTTKPAYRVRLADATELIASGDHRFLTERGWKFVAAAEAAIAIGDSLLGCRRGRADGVVEEQTVQTSADLLVIGIEPLDGDRELYDITTATGDFVANGVISHNCYARPSHAYLGLSPGLDFETRLVAKPNAAALLREELAAPSYVCKSIALGANTDPYQPIEREWKITRGVLEVLAECDHPFTIVTKSALVERDIDVLAPMAAKGLTRVFVSITNLDTDLARKLEPRAAAPYRRFETIKRLTAAGIPVGVLVAPVIPVVTDPFLEEILERAAAAGASTAGYILLRLPYEVAPLFKQWLDAHYPLKAGHVISIIRQTRGGRDYDSAFGRRHRGTGEFAELLRNRFELAVRRFGFSVERDPLDTTRFKRPARDGQMNLF
jgi:DNA repair photolyase